MNVTVTIQGRNARDAEQRFEARMEAKGYEVVQLGDFEPVDDRPGYWTGEAEIEEDA